ncbi:MAG: hypothetical protein E6522_06995 [Streptococcus vestibularis]|nr:hypothetical protein [Streptococcus vestibularis]
MNSKKIISSVSLTTAILATGIISQEAHADSVDTTTTTVSQAQSQPVTAEQVMIRIKKLKHKPSLWLTVKSRL